MTEPQVRLRPVVEADLDDLDRAADAAEDPWNFFGHRPVGTRRKQFAADGLLGADGGLLVVEVDGSLVGDVGYRPVRYAPPAAPPAYNIGISLRPEHRGRGYGAQAQRLLADYLFATYAINRVEASTDVENRAERRSLEKAGFSFEGVLRGAQWRGGAWHDLAGYARVRSDDSGRSG